jgi:hypothetical protein
MCVCVCVCVTDSYGTRYECYEAGGNVVFVIQSVPDLRTSALANRRPTCTDPDLRTVVHATNMGIVTWSPRGFEYRTND